MSTAPYTASPLNPPPLRAPRRQLGRGPAAAGTVGVGMAFSPLVLAALMAPKFAEMYRDFGVNLSRPTLAVLDLGNWLWTPIGLAFLVLLVLLGAATIAVSAKRSTLALIVLAFGVLLGLAGSAAVILLLQTPAVTMLESLQGGGRI